MTERELPDLLSGGDLTVVGRLPGASNLTLLVEVATPEGRARAVYKPAAGEAPLWDYPPGSLHRREVAAYEISRALGWPPVPVTVLREGPEGPGAVQGFVDALSGEHFFTIRDRHAPELLAFAVFDALINNGDRKGGHVLLDREGVVWGVDHGVSMGVEPNLRTVIWDFAGDLIPDALIEDVRRVEEDLRRGELGRRISKLLSGKEAEAAAERAASLSGSGRLPEPGPARPFPWPLV